MGAPDCCARTGFPFVNGNGLNGGGKDTFLKKQALDVFEDYLKCRIPCGEQSAINSHSFSSMQKEIGLFPLNIVVFEGENLNLHIFEPRYQQLVKDCIEHGVNFGIPAYIDHYTDWGTEVRVREVTKVYGDGRMDIKTEGVQAFRVLRFDNPWEDRLYAGGKIETLNYDPASDLTTREQVLELAGKFLSLLQMQDFMEVNANTQLHEILHKIGLKQEQEFDLLQLRSECDREKYLLNHFKRLLPTLQRMERVKEKIRMNGHFKRLDSPEL